MKNDKFLLHFFSSSLLEEDLSARVGLLCEIFQLKLDSREKAKLP